MREFNSFEEQESENTYFTESTEEQKTENTYSIVSTTEIVITTNINIQNFDSTIITQRPSVDTTILQSIISTNLDLEETKPISILTYLENEKMTPAVLSRRVKEKYS